MEVAERQELRKTYERWSTKDLVVASVERHEEYRSDALALIRDELLGRDDFVPELLYRVWKHDWDAESPVLGDMLGEARERPEYESSLQAFGGRITSEAAQQLGEIPGIVGIRYVSALELSESLAAGAYIATYRYCISLLYVTWHFQTDPIFVRSSVVGWFRGLPYSLVALLVGWWAVPWGVLRTFEALGTNLRGGKRVYPDLGQLAQADIELNQGRNVEALIERST